MAACGGKQKKRKKKGSGDDKKERTESGAEGRVAASSEKGAKHYQEDSWMIFCSANQAVSCIGVFDGSGGKNGQLASQKCKELAFNWCKEKWESLPDLDDAGWHKELNKLFQSMHIGIRDVFTVEETQRRARSKTETSVKVVDDQEIVRLDTGKPVSGGTTAAMCITVKQGNARRVICANVGDSFAVLCPLPERKPESEKGEQKSYEFLSTTDSPLNEEEYKRIQGLPNKKSDKLIFVYDVDNQTKKYLLPKIYLSFGKDAGKKDPKYVKDPWGFCLRPTNVRYDPAVYAITSRAAKEEVCLAVTRGLGYFHAQPFGLTWEPHVRIQTLDPRKKYLVAVASDGIWDAWKFEDFTAYATKTVNTYPNDLLRAVKMIVDASVARTKALFGDKSFDDASLCVSVVPRQRNPQRAKRTQAPTKS